MERGFGYADSPWTGRFDPANAPAGARALRVHGADEATRLSYLEKAHRPGRDMSSAYYVYVERAG